MQHVPSMLGRKLVPTTNLTRCFTACKTLPASLRMCRGLIVNEKCQSRVGECGCTVYRDVWTNSNQIR